MLAMHQCDDTTNGVPVMMPDDWDLLRRIYSGTLPAIITLATYFPATESQKASARDFYGARGVTRPQARNHAIAAHVDANRCHRKVEV